MKSKENPIQQNSQEQSDGLISPERRSFIEKLIALSAVAVASPALLVPNEAKANTTLTEDPNAYGGYPRMINRFRRAFGRREDYQQGFVGAVSQSDEFFRLSDGVYGILVENTSSQAIEPGSSYPVDRADYLHATQEIEEPCPNIKNCWMKARKELNDKIRKAILERHEQYADVQGTFGSLDLLDKISAPVVTIQNWRAKRLEMFLRIPVPGTREFFQMAMGERVDYYDQAKLRNEHAFDTMYDHSRSLFDNLTVIYGPELQVLGQIAQSGKNRLAQSINFVNQQIPSRFRLNPSQKNTLNNLLNVTGTTFEIR